VKVSLDKIALSITEDDGPLGSHLIHFWHTEDEFERGVRSLELGIAGLGAPRLGWAIDGKTPKGP